jgi:putative ABC transport system substrate-binding protein
MALTLFIATAGAAPADNPSGMRVKILVSGEHSAYRRAEAAAREALKKSAPQAAVTSVQVGVENRDQRELTAPEPRPSLVIAIGSRAARLAREMFNGAPLSYAMVLDPASVGLPSPGDVPGARVTGVTMEVTTDRQFDLMREMVPGLRRIGVIYDPSVSGEAVRRAIEVARADGLVLVPQAVRSEGEVLRAAQLLSGEVDAFWALADPTVLTPANARALILLALRAKKPLFAASEGFVRSGALAALAADPEEVGRRAAQMGLSLLDGKASKGLRPERPPSVALFLNRATAAHLGVSLPLDVVQRARAIYPQP